jgi:hypothetical protein
MTDSDYLLAPYREYPRYFTYALIDGIPSHRFGPSGRDTLWIRPIAEIKIPTGWDCADDHCTTDCRVDRDGFTWRSDFDVDEDVWLQAAIVRNRKAT